MACLKSTTAGGHVTKVAMPSSTTGTDSGGSPYPDNVVPGRPFPLKDWVARMFRKGILSEIGFCCLTYPDGKAMVKTVLDALGWASITNYRNLHPCQPVFFWCHGQTARTVTEWRRQLTSKQMGLQFVSSLPNVACLHNKKHLQQLIRGYELAVVQQANYPAAAAADSSPHLRFPADIRAWNSDDYLPRTLFDLTAKELRHIARTCFTDNSLWIAKPLSQNCGKGITLVRSRKQLLELEERLPDVIIQEYIRNPLTLEGRKSDLRVYLLLVCPERNHLAAFFHPGFVRLAMRTYTEDTNDLAVHLTNQSIAKETNEWKEQRDDSTWTPAELNDYLNARSRDTGFEPDFVFRQLYPTMRSILGIVSRAAYPRVTKVGGCFEFLGCDFMLDTNGKVWLIEINCYPGMATSTSLLRSMKPQVVQEAICLAMECISKQFLGKSIYPLESLQQFQLLWNSQD